jgi:hypothetical protein
MRDYERIQIFSFSLSIVFVSLLVLWIKPEQEVFCAMEKSFYHENCFTLFPAPSISQYDFHQPQENITHQNFVNLDLHKSQELETIFIYILCSSIFHYEFILI